MSTKRRLSGTVTFSLYLGCTLSHADGGILVPTYPYTEKDPVTGELKEWIKTHVQPDIAKLYAAIPADVVPAKEDDDE